MPKLDSMKLLESVDLDADKEQAMLEAFSASAIPEVCRMILNHRRRIYAELLEARKAHEAAVAALDELRDPPLYPGSVRRITADGRLDVVAGGRRQIVGVDEGVDVSEIVPGQEVLLDSSLSQVLALGEPAERTGLVGTVTELGSERVTLSGVADEELVASCPPELLAELSPGDRVLYTRDFPLVVDRLPERRESRYLLERPPDIRFADIGGLDAVIDELRRDLDLHALHRDAVRDYQLRAAPGVILVGGPGVGKTMIAGAMARHLAEVDPSTRFMHVRPGELRGMLYGQTEQRIRELFSVARAAPGLVLLFLDELDNFGTRGETPGHDIDGRVLASLLAEISGLDSPTNVFYVAATNRLDLVDTALTRQGRLGDRIVHIPRPGREATRQILARYLLSDLPYSEAALEAGGAGGLIDALVGYLHTPEGGAGPVATAVLSDAERYEIRAHHVLSGALIASAVERAKHAAAHRSLEGGLAIDVEDLLFAFDTALSAEARKVSAPHVARRMLDFERSDEIVRVDLPPARRLRAHRYLRAA